MKRRPVATSGSTRSLKTSHSTHQDAVPGTEAVFSPDGRWIAYTSDQSGRPEVYVQSRDGRGPRWQESTPGGAQPSWRADGAEVFFTGPDHQLFTVGIKREGQLELNPPVALFGFREAGRSSPERVYLPTPDGQQFAILPASANSQTPGTLIQMDRVAPEVRSIDIVCDPACGTAGFLVAVGASLRDRPSGPGSAERKIISRSVSASGSRRGTRAATEP